MKKLALLLGLLGACFFAGCAQEESATVETTEDVAPAVEEDAGTVTEDAATSPAL